MRRGGETGVGRAEPRGDGCIADFQKTGCIKKKLAVLI